MQNFMNGATAFTTFAPPIYRMALPIFYTPVIEQSDIVQLNEETSKHVGQVLRMKQGALLQLTDGKGNLITTRIIDDHKKKCTVSIQQREYRPAPTRQVGIAISLLKNNTRFEWFLEKATEIGVTEIIPMICHRTEKQHFRFDRMHNIVVAAMLQSQQVWLPVLQEPVAFKKVLENSYTSKLIAHCEEAQKASIVSHGSNSSVQILIGPEGDFMPEEIEAALSAGYNPVTLGDTRLRAETAGVVAATLLCIK